MSELSLNQRQSLPDALRVLMQEYPREAWEADPNFSALIRFWLDRHVMFRQLMGRLQEDVQAALEGAIDERFYAQKLARFGGVLVNDLHMHHQIEDAHYFPVLERQDSRVAPGFKLLDADHHDIDALLHGFTDAANALLQNPDGKDFKSRGGAVEAEIARMAPLLSRHLTDEEELVVPVLLKHAPAGLT